jgi:Ala-tRNA(Pro) deacylase
MIKVSDIITTAPAEFKTEVQKKVYETLEKLDIPFERIDTEDAITMEDCQAIDAKFGYKTVKTVFVCNRQQTNFYLFVTEGYKPFSTKDFGHALEISRVSFTPAEKLYTMLGTKIGATSVLSIVHDPGHKVNVVIDKQVADSEWYVCSDSTTTCYIKFKTPDILGKYLDFTGHCPTLITV